MADNKSTYSSLMNELVDTINEKANASDSKNLEELVATAKTIVKPEGTLEITENKQYDVSGYALANVNVASSGGENTLKALLDYTKSTKYMFGDNKTITDISEYIQYEDTENVEIMEQMFYLSSLTIAPNINTKNVKNAKQMFYGCHSLEGVIHYDTSKITVANFMFGQTSKLETISYLDLSNLEDGTSMFNSCGASSIHILNTINLNKAQLMFNNCPNLVTLDRLDLINVTSNTYAGNIFNNCPNLTNLTVLNIKVNLTVGNGTSYGHLLTIKSLLNTCQECIKQSSAKTLTVGSENLAKLSNIYVKLTDTTNTTKYPMEQCESTDEGAMLVADYMALKNWSLA